MAADDGDHVVPVTRLVNVEDYLDYISNGVMPDAAVRHSLEKLWSASAFAGSRLTDEQLDQLSPPVPTGRPGTEQPCPRRRRIPMEAEAPVTPIRKLAH